MSVVYHATFDGRVFTPTEPVDLPVGQTVRVVVPREVPPASEAPATPPVPAGNADVVDALPAGAGAEAFLAWLDRQPPAGEDLPTDLAIQHDHYLYGTPKRENP